MLVTSNYFLYSIYNQLSVLRVISFSCFLLFTKNKKNPLIGHWIVMATVCVSDVMSPGVLL